MKFKSTLIGWGGTILIITAFIAIIISVVKLTYVPKEPATAEQVLDVLISHGYKPFDLTGEILEKYPNSQVNKNISIQEEDLRFDFYIFNSTQGAVDLYSNAYSSITRTKKVYPFIEYDAKIANYCIYTLTSSGEYNVSLYVGNTAVSAHCKEENSEKISSILQDIGYFEPAKENNINKEKAKKLLEIVYFAIQFVLTWVFLRILWTSICEIAYLNMLEVHAYKKKNNIVFNFQKKLYNWMESKSPDPQKFKRWFILYHLFLIPSLFFLSVSIIGCFTNVFDDFIDTCNIAAPVTMISIVLISIVLSSFATKGQLERRM